MRHRKNFNHLSRKTAHRKAMLANMANSLIIHKRISTTTAKAKALRMYVEPLITRSKEDTTHSRRIVFSQLQDKDAVSELFRDVAPKIIDRPGGYTRILKTGTRLGDAADMCIIELVDYNQNLLGDTGTSKTSSRRRRRGGKKKSEDTEATTETQVADVVEDAQVVEETKIDAEPAEDTKQTGNEAPVAEDADDTKQVKAEAEEAEGDETSEEDKEDTNSDEKKES